MGRLFSRKKIILLCLFLCSLFVVLCGGKFFIQNNPDNCWKDSVRFLGRYYSNYDGVWFDYTCSGIEFDYKSEGNGKITVDFVTDDIYANDPKRMAWVGVYINDDNEPYEVFPLDNYKVTKTIYENDHRETLKIKIIKLSEAKYGRMEISALNVMGGDITPTLEKEMKIELIGDSITCGHGNETTRYDEFTTRTENGYMTYGAILARELNADVNIIAYSGLGVWHSTDSTEPLKALEIYNWISPFNKQMWNFDSYVPDYIIINLGTNDSRFIKSEDEKKQFREAYECFIRQIMIKNNNAEIICTVGPMNYDTEEIIEEIVSTFDSEQVHFFTFSSMRSENDFGTGNHPTLVKHNEMFNELYDFFKMNMLQ